MNTFSKLKKIQCGATMVEYAIVMALIALAAIAFIKMVGDKVVIIFNAVQI